MVRGIQGVSVDYAGRVKNFLLEYMGTPERPVPFGGRDDQLHALDAWLNDPADRPYCLIAASAGRGKSALLVRWADSLVKREEVHVIFVPTSIRFNTAEAEVTFACMAARLMTIYGDAVEWADRSSQQWRGICLQYMARKPPDGKRLVVILDGLDEAADWRAGPDLFPLDPPPGVRVVVSARFLAGDIDERGWLERLHWNSDALARMIHLPALSREGLKEVLAAMGRPLDKLATQVDVVGELFRLSQGDPLLVRLYIEALLPYGDRAAIIRPEELPSIQEGLDGYFERWWKDQQDQWRAQNRDPLAEKEELLTFLNVCASALGPLSRDDVAILARGNLTSGLRIKSITDEVARFVIGDGQKQGYVFGHPRLGQYFWDEMTDKEHDQWLGKFLNYGRRTLEGLDAGTMSPERASPYIVRYYGAHLQRVEGPPGRLWALVSAGWQQAWYALDGTYSGFLNDVERAWRAAETSQLSNANMGPSGESLAMQFRCALCQASVTALSASIPVSLLIMAKQYGVLTPLQVLMLARQIPDERTRADAFVGIAPDMPDWLLEEVLAATQHLASETTQGWTLRGLAPYLTYALRKTALDTARTFHNPRARTLALGGLAPYLTDKLREAVVHEALDAVRQIQIERVKSNALRDVIPALIPGDPSTEEARSIIGGIQDPGVGAELLHHWEQHMSAKGRPTNSEQTQNEAKGTGDDVDVVETLEMAQRLRLVDENNRERAVIEILRAIHDYDNTITLKDVLSIIAPILSERMLELAVQVILGKGHFWFEPERSFLRGRLGLIASIVPGQAYHYMATYVPRANWPGWLKRLSEEEFMVGLLNRTGPNLEAVSIGQIQEAISSTLSEKASDYVSKEIPAENYETLAHGLKLDFANLTAKLEHLDAISPLLPFLSPAVRAMLHSEIKRTISTGVRRGYWASPISWVDRLSPSTLTEVREAVNELLPELAREMNDLPNTSTKVGILGGLATLVGKLISEKDFKSVLREILKQAQTINDSGRALQIGIQLVQQFPKERQAEALAAILIRIDGLRNPLTRFQLVQQLVPWLPERVVAQVWDLVVALQEPIEAIHKGRLLIEIMQLLPPTHREEALANLIDLLNSLPLEKQKHYMNLESLIEYIPPARLMDITEVVKLRFTRRQYMRYLVKLLKQEPDAFSKEDLEKALADALRASDQQNNFPIQIISTQQGELQLELTLRLMEILEDGSIRVDSWTHTRVLISAMHLLPEMIRTEHLSNLLQNMGKLYSGQQVEIYQRLARYFPKDLHLQALSEARNIGEANVRSWVLAALVPYLSTPLQETALDELRSSLDQMDPVEAMSIFFRLAPTIAEEELNLWLGTMFRHLQDTPDYQKAKVLSRLAPYLSGQWLEKSLALADSFPDTESKCKAYLALSLHVTGTHRETMLKKALVTITDISWPNELINAVDTLASKLPTDAWRQELYEKVLIISDGKLKLKALASLGRHLPDRSRVAVLNEAFVLAHKISSRKERAQVMIELAGQVPPVTDQMQKWLRVVLAMREQQRQQGLQALAPRLATWGSAQVLPAYALWKESIRELSKNSRPTFTNDMRALLPFTLSLVKGNEKERAIQGILLAFDEVSSWWS